MIVSASAAARIFPATAESATPTRLAILDFGYFDTSGEPSDQEAEHKSRLAAMAGTLRAELAQGDLFEIIPMAAEAPGPCPEPDPERDPDCILARARQLGVDVVLTGVVHKASTMESQMWISGYDTATAQRVFYRNLSFRGDTDDAWHRASLFLARQINEHPPRRR